MMYLRSVCQAAAAAAALVLEFQFLCEHDFISSAPLDSLFHWIPFIKLFIVLTMNLRWCGQISHDSIKTNGKIHFFRFADSNKAKSPQIILVVFFFGVPFGPLAVSIARGNLTANLTHFQIKLKKTPNSMAAVI